MSDKKNLDHQLQQTMLKMKELSIKKEHLAHTYQQLLTDLAMTPEEVLTYAKNPDNFSPPLWEELQNEKKKLEEELELELSQVRDPLKTKKSLSEQGLVKPHWIFVR